MDKDKPQDEKTPNNSQKEERENMTAVPKKEQFYKGLSLSSKKLNEISIKPKVGNGKVLLDKNNKDHRYVMDEE